MDCKKVGRLLLTLRQEKHWTQKQLAEALYLSDRTISKWERGLGCPDISLLRKLSMQFGVHVDQLLSGELNPNDRDGGNMKRIQFYVCQNCGNIMTATGKAAVSCCGRTLAALVPQSSDVDHALTVETVEDDYYITFSHAMQKSHFLNFVTYVDDHRLLLIRLYPEQGGEIRFPKLIGGKIYYGCSQHGLFVYS